MSFDVKLLIIALLLFPITLLGAVSMLTFVAFTLGKDFVTELILA